MPAQSGTSSTSIGTSSSLGSSWVDESPSRRSPARNGNTTPSQDRLRRSADRSAGRNSRNRRATMSRDALESPSRLPTAAQLTRYSIEVNQMLTNTDREFHSSLDKEAAERARLHNEQLSRAAYEHERIRQGAERERQRVELEQEQARLKREEEQRQVNERLRLENERKAAEARQRDLEARRKADEAARQAAEDQKRRDEEEVRQRARIEQEEAARKHRLAQEEADRKTREAAEAAERARAQQAAAQPKPAPTTALAPEATLAPALIPASQSQFSASSPEAEELHQKYLNVHRLMKALQKDLKDKKNGKILQGDMKQMNAVGDRRRDLKGLWGKITVNGQSAKDVIALMREKLEICRHTGPTMIDLRPYMITQLTPEAAQQPMMYPVFLLYAFIILSKTLLKSFEAEAAKVDAKIISNIGAVAASIFADTNYYCNGCSLIDILYAKWHRNCPPLFGIHGARNSPAGQERLGILKDFGNVNHYVQRMLGYGLGFACMSLRNVSRPSIPPREYWRALADIINTPTDALYDCHYALVKGMVRTHYKKFVQMYGKLGRAMIRRAVVEFPQRAPKEIKPTASQVEVLPEYWAKNENFRLMR